MRYSVSVVATDQSISVTALATLLEESGFDGLWLPDHTHVPVARRSPYPPGGELPERYKRTLDPLVALTSAAAVTTRLRIGTGILLAGARDPIVTAKALATLDHLSDGRLRVGVGYGWNLEELADHGVDPATRRARTREHVEAMQALWRDEKAAFSGQYVTFEPAWSWPKPRQDPLPVLLGAAATDRVFDHVATFAHGWIPVGGAHLADAVRRLKERCSAHHRDPSSLEIIPFTSSEASHDKLDAFARAGATEVAFEVRLTDPGHDYVEEIAALGELVAERREGVSP
jgi:probable F420-dependent oxidoreductase